MSSTTYADIAAKNSDQTPEEAAAPAVPELEQQESQTISTESLVDVDLPSVRSVPADFLEQDVQTTTQAEREERTRALQQAKAAADASKKAGKASSGGGSGSRAAAKAREVDGWLVTRVAALSEGQATGIVFANLAAVVGLSAVLGYKAWGLHERNALSWRHAGVGAAIVGAVGVAEGVFSQFLTKARGSKA